MTKRVLCTLGALILAVSLLAGCAAKQEPQAAAGTPQAQPAQTETAAPTLPVETAEPIPDLPEGSVVLDVQYAVRDGSLVRYKYDVYTDRSGPDADGEDMPLWKPYTEAEPWRMWFDDTVHSEAKGPGKLMSFLLRQADH